jgi:hypothetical protein
VPAYRRQLGLVFLKLPTKFTTIPLVFDVGALMLLSKAPFLLRKPSEGVGLSELRDLSNPANRKSLPSIPSQAAQILQDFASGAFLLWPLLNFAKDIDSFWTNPPGFQVFCDGAVLFSLGWVVRRFIV